MDTKRVESYKKFIYIVLLTITLLSPSILRAQYFVSEVDPIMKWSQIEAKNQKIIFPQNNPHLGLAIASYLDTLSPYITRGFYGKLIDFPALVHTKNILSNGMVTYAPKRMELYSIPSRNTFATQWLRQLISHEYRHVAQMSSLNVGFTKGLSYVLGQQAPGLVALLLPGYFLEGDAVLTETLFSTFGRGRQPNFLVEMRAIINEQDNIYRGKNKKLNYNKLILGSYRDFVPDIYKSGYLLVSASNRYFGADFWGKTLDYTGRYPYTIIPVTFSFKKYAKSNSVDLANRAFDELKQHWDSAAMVNNSTDILKTKLTSYSVYSSLLPLNDTIVLALKKDLDRTSRFVAIDKNSGKEKMLFYTGYVTSRPIIKDNKLYWTEYKPSASWGMKNGSVVRSADIVVKRNGKVSYKIRNSRKVTPEGVFYVTAMGDNGYAMFSYNELNKVSLIFTDKNFKITEQKDFDWFDASVNGLTWDNKTNTLAAIILDNNGMWLGKYNFESQSFERITLPSYVTLNDLSATDGKLYFTSIVSGKDEVNSYDLTTGKEMQITQSKYGTVASSLGSLWSQPTNNKGEMLATTYTIDGYLPSTQKIEEPYADRSTYQYKPHDFMTIEFEKLLESRFKENPIINLDDVKLDSSIYDDYKVEKYKKGAHLFSVHSYMPLFMDVEKIMDEQTLAIGAGATILSQNIHSTMISGAGIGYYNKMFTMNAKIEYTGLPVHFSFDADYGGGHQSATFKNKEAFDNFDLSTLNKYWGIGIGMKLPFNLSNGVNNRTLQAGVSYNYDNTLLVSEGSQAVGTHKMSSNIIFQNIKSRTTKQIAPRLGYIAQIYSSFNLSRRDFGTVYGVYGMGYLPGLVHSHSLQLQGLYQYQKERDFNFSQKGMFALGSYDQFTAKEIYGVKAAYEAPLFYPDWGLGAIIYFSRVSMKLIGEYSYAEPTEAYKALPWRNFYTYGGGINTDIKLFRIGSPINIGLLVYKNNTIEKAEYLLEFSVDL